MAVFTPTEGGSGGVQSVNAINLAGKTPAIQTVSMPLASTEYTLVVPANTLHYVLKGRVVGELTIALSSGASDWFTVPKGTAVQQGLIDLDVPLTLYLTSNVPGQTVEILSWSN